MHDRIKKIQNQKKPQKTKPKPKNQLQPKNQENKPPTNSVDIRMHSLILASARQRAP